MSEEYFNTLRKSLQTTSALPCRTQVQPAASFLVCSLIFIEYEPILSQKIRESYVGCQKNALKSKKVSEKATAPAVAFIVFLFLIACWSCTCAADVQAFLEIEAKG